MRADAVANREAIITAVIKLWADAGTGVPLRAIASEAGVGIGTLYRHFPDKEDLARGVTDAVVASIDRIAERYDDNRREDPASAWRDFVAELVSLHLGRLIPQLVADPDLAANAAWAERARRRGLARLDAVLTHAKADGQVRDDVGTAHLQIAVAQISCPLTDYADRLVPGWDRWLVEVLLRGLRP